MDGMPPLNQRPAVEIRQMSLGPLQTNCYLVGCGVTRRAVVIDPAADGQAIAALAERDGWKIGHILLTHAHFDHVGGLEALKTATGAPISVHPDAVTMLAGAPRSAALFGLTISAPPPADELLADGQELHVGDFVLQVLYTPGHAPGHVCFYLPAHLALFDGDVLFRGSVGRTDFPNSDHQLLMRSIREKLLTLPDETRVFSGHGPATTIGEERATNPFLLARQ
jgi:glyoxylase-like metal-dependent hydrolase (beta-lactamase superfamily II)